MINSVTDEKIEIIREKIRNTKNAEIELDLSSMNIIEASKIAVLSSALYYSKHPDGKIKCRLQSETVKHFISGLAIKNLEFV